MYGDFLDIWSAPRAPKSKEFERYRNTFAKTDHVNVKAVVLPKGGQSYNPR